ncbi:disintegrin and metalloproteinase domain-containing protein 12 isoform X2 [Heterodontus francisci]|uniref:disintegrin and metalloproteinase domain-containing protein 12 isoform X2 n=1 Tax=Heterodontus francisci TaxID=7792 RepID=UPI00355B205D
MDLERNENLLSGAHQLIYYLPNGTLVTEEDTNPTNCYYHGRVNGFPDSRVSVSLCSGLRGLIVLTRNQSYGIEPLSGDRNEVHLIYRIQPVHFNQKRCAVSHHSPEHSALQEEEEESRHHRLKRDILTETKYIELVMVADNKEFQDSGYNLRSLQMRLLEIANQVDAFYRPLNIRVALVGVEVWSKKDPFEIVKSPSDTLKRFLKWRERDLLPRLHHDNAQLLIGGTFDGGTIGMASQSSMCSRDRSGGVNVDHSVSVLGVGSTVAHELGHNLGISHDTDDRKCTCLNPKRLGGCIMEPSTGFLPGQAFSSCSKDDLERSLKHGGAMCLFNFPASDRLFGGQRCGNLYLEEGEECDCGLADECDDPCCNASTCRLVPGAECSTEGACCENCKLKSAATVCRLPLGDCDLPEYCNGVTPYCPPNVFRRNGLTCNNARAYCYNGACLTFEQQCQVLWGPGSVQADDICFTTVNKKGDKYGNCGEHLNGTFMSCAEVDAKCGKIQCQGGNDRPVLGSNAEILVTNIKVGSKEYSCRGTYFNFGDDIADPAMVMPGTVCGERKACINRKCQDVSMLGVEECLQKCNNHGVCNSNDNCHCDAGWAPPDCKQTGYGGSIDSGPVQGTQGKGTMLIALLVTFLLVLSALLLLCYCKRELVRSELQKLGKGNPQQHSATGGYRLGFLRQQIPPDEEWDSRMENGTQAPPAGRLRCKPSEWLQQTEMRPAQSVKPIPQPLSRPAPPSKPLPPDPVVKLCQPAHPLRPTRPPPPSMPLPADPMPDSRQPPLPRKPPPPKKPLPSDPAMRPPSGMASVQPEDLRVPLYAAQHLGAPSRPAPPPPGKKPPLPLLPSANA